MTALQSGVSLSANIPDALQYFGNLSNRYYNINVICGYYEQYHSTTVELYMSMSKMS